MSADQGSSTNESTIYVRLLDEGTDVFRPSPAIALGGDVYELLRPEFYDPEDERWEFEPGCRVHALPRTGADGDYLVAASLAE